MEAHKVTDLKKKVTDPVLLAELKRRGFNKDYVEFTQDYDKRIKGKCSPYAKFYHDLKSGARFMVVSQLPMVTEDGESIEAAWAYDEEREIWYSKLNLFYASVDGNTVKIICLADQPHGIKKSDFVEFQPQLFLDGIEIKPKAAYPDWLERDPVNKNYHQNVLQWDYGICKRRLRIIEGRLLGSWVFDKNPEGEIKFRYNQSGKFKLKLGQYAVSDDEELITKEQFENAEYPLEISDSVTFYPDADPETTSVDGCVQRITSNETWSAIHSGAGTYHSDSGIGDIYLYIRAGTTTNMWNQLQRAIVLFDTSSIPDSAVITAATLSIRGGWKVDYLSISPSKNVYASTPASDTGLVNADYSQVGSTAFCDTPISYSSYSITGYNDWALNALGLAAISKTGVSKFSFRFTFDADNTAPTWSSSQHTYMEGYSAEQGTGYKPKLVVIYTTGETKQSSDDGSGTEAVALRQLDIIDTGSGSEESLGTAVILTGDAGTGSEMGGLLKGLFSQDEGSGLDNIKILTTKSGSDLRLHSYHGQVGIPHKEVKL